MILSPTLFAWSLGAEYIERHITNDRTNWGTDQSVSLEGPGMGSSHYTQESENFMGMSEKNNIKRKRNVKKFKY